MFQGTELWGLYKAETTTLPTEKIPHLELNVES